MLALRGYSFTTWIVLKICELRSEIEERGDVSGYVIDSDQEVRIKGYKLPTIRNRFDAFP
jgi:hypothetical protein